MSPGYAWLVSNPLVTRLSPTPAALSFSRRYCINNKRGYAQDHLWYCLASAVEIYGL